MRPAAKHIDDIAAKEFNYEKDLPNKAYLMKQSNPQNSIKIIFEPDGNKIEAPPGISIFDAAVRTGNKIRFECGGNGKCGKCRIIVKDQNSLTGVTVQEKKHLSQSEIEKGYRLACQALVKKDAMIFIPLESRTEPRKIQINGFERSVEISPLVRKIHVILPEPTLSDARPDLERIIDELNMHNLTGLDVNYEVLKELPNILREANWDVTVTIWNDEEIISVEEGDTSNRKFGASIDVGTSKIVAYLVDLGNGATLSVGSVENPQILFGEDVITRIFHAIINEEDFRKLQNTVIEGLNKALKEAYRDAGIVQENVYETTIVGNTAMHHLLLGLEPKYLAASPFTPAVKTPIKLHARELNIEINPNGVLYFLPVIAGFIGSDAVADILSTGVSESKEYSLLLDIGTNTEIFLGNTEDILSCSCASGPAFEGGHIKCGMKAVTGAIEKVCINPDTFEVQYETIGGGKPRGLCGSAIIDVVAEMWKYGIINSNGRFNSSLEASRLRRTDGYAEFVLVSKEDSAIGQEIVVNQKDINEIQLAKAAIYTGCSILMKKRGLREQDISRVLIAGAFGRYINPINAKLIGLMPDVDTEKIRFVGNTAITGAKMALLSKKVRREAEELSKKVKYLELSADPAFMSEFASALFIPHRDRNRFQSVKNSKLIEN